MDYQTDWKRLRVACDLAGKAGLVTVAKWGDGVTIAGADEINSLQVGPCEKASPLGAVRTEAFSESAKLPAPDLIELLVKQFQATLPTAHPQRPSGLRTLGEYGYEFLEAVGSIFPARKAGPGFQIMAGVHLYPWRLKTYAVCTDNKRVAAASIGKGIPTEITIDPSTIRLLKRVWARKQWVQISTSPNCLRFAALDGSWTVLGKPLEGDLPYPNPLGLLDEQDNQPTLATFEPKELAQLFKQAGKCLKAKGKWEAEVILPGGEPNGLVRVSSPSGMFEGKFPLETQPIKGITWNWPMPVAMAWIRRATDTVQLKANSPDSPVFIRSGDLFALVAPSLS